MIKLKRIFHVFTIFTPEIVFFTDKALLIQSFSNYFIFKIAIRKLVKKKIRLKKLKYNNSTNKKKPVINL